MTQRVKAITNIPGWLDDLTGSGIPNDVGALYSSVPMLYRALNVRCDALSAVPVKFTRGETEVDWPYPEPFETLIWRAEASLMMTGGAYWNIVKNAAGWQKNVKYLNPGGMSVTYKNGVLTFKQGRVEWTNDLTADYYEMVYFADYSPAQIILPGVGAAEAAKTDARLLNALAQFPEKFFEGGAMPVTLLGIDTTDSGEIARIEAWFKRSVTSVRNAFRVVGMRAKGIEPKTLTPNLDTLTMPELSQEAKKNISLALGVPESMLDTTASNFATAKEARLSFYEDTIKSRARMFEGVINQQLLAADGIEMRFDFEAMQLFQEDEGDRAEVLGKLTAAGIPLKNAMEIAGYKPEQIEALPGEQVQADEARPAQQAQPENEMPDELRRWQRMAEKRVRSG